MTDYSAEWRGSVHTQDDILQDLIYPLDEPTVEITTAPVEVPPRIAIDTEAENVS